MALTWEQYMAARNNPKKRFCPKCGTPMWKKQTPTKANPATHFCPVCRGIAEAATIGNRFNPIVPADKEDQ